MMINAPQSLQSIFSWLDAFQAMLVMLIGQKQVVHHGYCPQVKSGMSVKQILKHGVTPVKITYQNKIWYGFYSKAKGKSIFVFFDVDNKTARVGKVFVIKSKLSMRKANKMIDRLRVKLGESNEQK